MQEFEADGAAYAHQDISVIDEQAGQSAGIMFDCITQTRDYDKGPDNTGNQVG
jgi:hypothetical protein